MSSKSKVSAARSGRRWLVFLLLLCGLGGSLWWYWPQLGGLLETAASPENTTPAGGERSRAGGRPPRGSGSGPTPVRVMPVVVEPFEVFYPSLGTVTALNTVNIRSRVAGELVEIAFEEGQKIKAGDLLARIDPRPYRIALEQAKGTLAQNRALLKNARLDLARYQKLYADDSIARQTLDTQQADVNQYQGMIANNQAAVDEAQLNLDYTEIRAPIDGRLGLRQLDVGNLLSANDTTVLAVITQTQPISIIFTLPEKDLAPVLRRFRQGEQLLVQAWDRNNQELLAEGVLHSIDNQIDLNTGTLALKARFDNEDELLLPNQFVNVLLRVETLESPLLIPSAAIQHGNQGAFVYVVEGRKAHLKRVEVGETDGQRSVIREGLSAGEQVVLEGTERLREGAPVKVVSYVEGDAE